MPVRWCSFCGLRARAPRRSGRRAARRPACASAAARQRRMVELYDDATTPTTPLGASLFEAPRLGEQNAAGASRPLRVPLCDAERYRAHRRLCHRARACRPRSTPRARHRHWRGLRFTAMLAARAGALRVLALEMTAEIAALATARRGALTTAAGGCRCTRRRWTSTRRRPALGRRALSCSSSVLGTDPLCEGCALAAARARVAGRARRGGGAARAHGVCEPGRERGARVTRLRVARCDARARPAPSERAGARLARGAPVGLPLAAHDAAVALRLELDGAEPPAEAGEATTELVVRRGGRARGGSRGGKQIWWRRDRLDGARRGRLDAWPQWGQLAVFLAPGGVRVDAGATCMLRTRYTDQGLAFELT